MAPLPVPQFPSLRLLNIKYCVRWIVQCYTSVHADSPQVVRGAAVLLGGYRTNIIHGQHQPAPASTHGVLIDVYLHSHRYRKTQAVPKRDLHTLPLLKKIKNEKLVIQSTRTNVV